MAINYDKESYGMEKALATLADWGYDLRHIKQGGRISERAQPGLFDDDMATLIRLSDPNKDINKKRLSDALDAVEEDPDYIIGNGLVIIYSLPENLKETKRAISLIKNLGGVYSSPKKNKTSEISEILSKVSLNPQVREDLIEFVGDSYDTLLPLVKEISNFTVEQQRRLRWEDLYPRIPQKPGQLPLFGRGSLEELILARDKAKALDKLDRLLEGGTPEIMIVVVLRKKFSNMYRIKSLLECGLDRSAVAGVLGLPDPRYRGKGQKDPKTGKNGYPTVKAMEECDKWSLKSLENAMLAISRAEAMMKGEDYKIKMSMKPNVALAWMIAKILDYREA